ncbi:hypothetical protein OG230_29110 [Streptomyces sp. NBC_00234]|uniref:hypothetical protein n=1 Tax=Streptomyces sp. NBC_00234 TaxID=2903638 RepID=UPI002E29630E|nr:hypothetical protein [Streptomyces sp. NBC_00234]
MTYDATDRVRPTDLPGLAFIILSERFFDEAGKPVPFRLREKRNTQDDPFDEYVAEILKEEFQDDTLVLRADKPLVSPDVIVARPEEYYLLETGGADYDTRAIFGLEVKKVDLGKNGKPARASGLDYNSTPPCETIRVYSATGSALRIPSYYLFVTLAEGVDTGTVYVHSLVLVAGAALNKDVVLYERITGTRKKQIGLGTYGDGADRQRPMLVFPNPLGWEWLTGSATLISERGDLSSEHPLAYVREMTRSVSDGVWEIFHCYRLAKLSPEREELAEDPFPQPAKRKEETSQRGRFEIDLRTLTIG